MITAAGAVATAAGVVMTTAAGMVAGGGHTRTGAGGAGAGMVAAIGRVATTSSKSDTFGILLDNWLAASLVVNTGSDRVYTGLRLRGW
jgi:hypothetical protein